jgi:hypothetical protein
MSQIKINLFCFIFLLSYQFVSTQIPSCRSCIKAFDLNNTVIADIIYTASTIAPIIYGNAGYNQLQTQPDSPIANITGTITTPYNTQLITNIINAQLPCDCDVIYAGIILDNITLYPGRTCFTNTSQIIFINTITFDALNESSSIFILTFLSSLVQFNTGFTLINNAQPCNINLIAPNRIVLSSTIYYGNFFTSSLTINSFDFPIIHGGLYCNDTLVFDTYISFTQVYPCTCQTSQTTRKQIIYNIKCLINLPCPL